MKIAKLRCVADLVRRTRLDNKYAIPIIASSNVKNNMKVMAKLLLLKNTNPVAIPIAQ